MGRKAYQGIVIIVAMMLFLSLAPLTEGVAGGEPANPGEFPHAVQLYSIDREHHFCGGSIIAPSVILTAAHCVRVYFQVSFFTWVFPFTVDESPENILVTAGTLTNRQWKPFQEGQSIPVDHYVLHPNYNQLVENDIALLFLKKPLIYNDKVQPVQLPPPNVIFPKGTLAGWGWTDWKNSSSTFLKKLELVFERKQSCNRLMDQERKVNDLELCAKSEKGRELCKGDSGSAVICRRYAAESSSQKYTPLDTSLICGIASWVKAKGPCGESDNIAVSIDVSQYLNWIQDTMEAEGFGNLIKPLTCSESEGFFNCGELDGKKMKSRCILIEKKCDGAQNCANGRDENETICSTSKPTETVTKGNADPEGTQKIGSIGTGTIPEQNKMPVWLLLCVIFSTLILI